MYIFSAKPAPATLLPMTKKKKTKQSTMTCAANLVLQPLQRLLPLFRPIPRYPSGASLDSFVSHAQYRIERFHGPYVGVCGAERCGRGVTLLLLFFYIRLQEGHGIRCG